MKKGRRDTQLVANFVNGYADGWFMAVRECYRNQLDIKFMERKKQGKSFYEWTQGPYFSFGEGHLFYDTPKGYMKWEEALKAIKVACKITSGTPTTLAKNRNLIEGTVEFTIYRPNGDFTSLVPVKNCRLFQKDFVNFLKTGELNEEDDCGAAFREKGAI